MVSVCSVVDTFVHNIFNSNPSIKFNLDIGYDVETFAMNQALKQAKTR